MMARSSLRKRLLFIVPAILLMLGVSGVMSVVPRLSSGKQDVTVAGDSGEKEEGVFYPLAIKTSDGTQLLQVELALTPEEMQWGLMWRTELDADKGMLFVFPTMRHVSFWMRNTLIPLDLLYITDSGVINHIHPMAQPHDESPLPSKGGEVIAVLEIGGGQAAQKGIQIGDTLDSDLLLKGTSE